MKTPLTYQNAGVNINEGAKLVDAIKPLAKSTHNPHVISALGGFSSLFSLPTAYKEPLLVATTDGVGTKLKLAMALKKHDTIGIDLVAMCVNDIITQGARPLFFLDYYATGHLATELATTVIKGIVEGCRQANVALVGGETAEMPGMYSGDDYDLAGFCVGVVEKSQVINGSTVNVGDKIIGLASSGIHSNGYSLVRKVLSRNNITLNQRFEQHTLGDELMVPTKIYVNSVNALLENIPVKAIAHITGGGIVENLPRVLPEHCTAEIDRQSWEKPAIFSWLQAEGNIPDKEMYRTFNCGIGMVLCISAENTPKALRLLKEKGETAWEIGKIIPSENEASIILQ